MHQLKKTIMALLLVFSMVLSLATFALADETGTVTADCVRIHTEASTESEVFQQANKGDKLTVLEPADENGWVKVSFTYTETGATKTGYIAADYLSTGGSASSEDSEEKSEKSETKKSEQSDDKSETKDSKTEQKSEQKKDDSSSKDTKKKDSESSDSSNDSKEEEEETAVITSHVSYTATVTDSGVRIRKKANTDSKILTTVPEGDIVTVLSTEDDEGWMKIRYYDVDGKKYNGYMSGEYLDINSIGGGVSRVVNSIIRESPDNESPITGVVPLNRQVDIYASDNNWYKIEYQDLSGWIHSDCIRTEGDSDCIGYGTVTTDGLNLREKTSIKSSSLTKIPEGVTFQITSKEKKGKWYAATFNGLSGYVSAEYVDVSNHCTSGYVQVTATSLSLRSGAGANYARLAIVPQGKVLKVEGSVGAWYQVSYGKFTGYVSGAFVSSTTKDGFQAYPDFAEVTATSLTLRSDATTDSDALASIPEGAILAISGIYNGWYKVTYGGQTGYIDSGYVERSTEAAAAAYEEVVRAAQEAAAAAQNSDSGSSGETAASSSGGGGDVLAYASQFVGNPYVWGGTSLTNGADCSGFVKSVFAHYGISLPHSSSAIRGYGRSVSYSDMRPGDVVCYSGHVGIYAGNGQLLSALGKKYGITYNSVNYKKIITIRRMK